jgi:hypothetical protein
MRVNLICNFYKTQKIIVFLLFFILPFIVSPANAQKAIYVELLGTGGVGSLNYENCFTDYSKLDLSYKLGYSMAPIDKNNGVALVFPAMLNASYGENHHFIEMGLGQALTVSTKGKIFLVSVANAGYKYSPTNKKYFLRIAYTPIISYLIDFQWQNWGGIGIGFYIAQHDEK